jgi:hypothetical protein
MFLKTANVSVVQLFRVQECMSNAASVQSNVFCCLYSHPYITNTISRATKRHGLLQGTNIIHRNDGDHTCSR